MAGIYVHIPFCKQICNYCDFYKVGNLSKVDRFIEALLREIKIKKCLLNETVNTVYFGGGTPSLLKPDELMRIIESLKRNFTISDDAEFTIELNPEDSSADYYNSIKGIGFNRLSIGIQSFSDNISEFLNRRHNSATTFKSIDLALLSGFKNISIDLIYGIPGQSISNFIDDLKYVKNYEIAHLSAYHLGIEENTYFGKLKKMNKLCEIDENMSEKFFYTLTNWADNNGYEHYELSNFAYKKQYSVHNKNYWFHVPYLSFGPSAHSYVGGQRHYNIANLNRYIKAIFEGKAFYEIDQVSDYNVFNEYIMLRLRTMWGIKLNDVNSKFGKKYLKHCLEVYSKFKTSGYLLKTNDNIRLTKKGFFASDYIFREFFIN